MIKSMARALIILIFAVPVLITILTVYAVASVIDKERS